MMSLLSDKETKIIQSHSFAQIISSQHNQTGFAELSYCPLQLVRNNQLLGHLARNNPILKLIKKSAELPAKVKVVFSGPHGYSSPRWHSEQVVPTWNYTTVSLTCSLNVIEGSTDKLTAMETISHYFDPQWDFRVFNHEENQKMVQQMLSAITVFSLEILEVNSKFKLSQNRSTECRKAFQKNLNLTGYKGLADIQLL